MCRNTLLKSRALHSYSMNCRTYQNHKRKSNPSKQSGSVNIDWTGAAVVKVRGAMDRQFFSQGFHVAFGQNTQSSISTNRKIRSSTPCLFAAREKRKGSSFLAVSREKNPPLFKFNSRGVGFENVGILFVLWSPGKKYVFQNTKAVRCKLKFNFEVTPRHPPYVSHME